MKQVLLVFFCRLGLLATVVFAQQLGYSCNNNDRDRHLCSLDTLNRGTNVAVVPSGAPPTNDGFAYSQISYSATTLHIAGQNGYDSCGRLVPRDYDYVTGRSHSLTRIAIAYLNVAAATECFNMDITHIPGLVAYIADTWNRTRLDTAEQVSQFINERSLVNWVQIFFWGFDPKMTRTLPGPYALSRGDTFEVRVEPIPRINTGLPTCLQTNIPPRAAAILKNWTLSGEPPADMDAFLFEKTGLRLGRGLGACSNPELRNDDWSRGDLVKAPRFGDAGDLMQGENWNAATMNTHCVSVPARVKAPAANLFVRTLGARNSGKPVHLLVHGTSASHNYWRGVQNLLSRRSFTVNVDLRGHGQSQITPATVPAPEGGFRYDNEAFADDLDALLTALNITEKVICNGISIGASVCIRFAAKYPQRTERVVLVSGASRFRCADHPNTACASWLTGVATTPITLLPEDVASGCNVENARAKINQNRAANVSGVAVTNLLEYAQKEDQTAFLVLVKAPTLIIHGLADPTLNVKAAEALHSGIVNSVRADFVNRGHLVPITAYVDIANIITRFTHSNAMPEITRVLDTSSGCAIASEVAPETNFEKCPSI